MRFCFAIDTNHLHIVFPRLGPKVDRAKAMMASRVDHTQKSLYFNSISIPILSSSVLVVL